MIIDAHAHIFSRIAGENRSGKLHSSRYGWVTVNGNSPKSMLLPFFTETSFEPEVLIRLMDREGVDKAVLLQNPTFGINNEEIANAIGQYPERFIGTVQADPMHAGAAETIRKFAGMPRQNILKVEMSEDWGWSGIYPGLKLDETPMTNLWEEVAAHNFQVIIDTGPVHQFGYQIEAIDKISGEYPDTIFIIEHLGYMTPENYWNPELRKRWAECINLARKKNIYLGFSAAGILMEEEYPCKQSLALLKETVEKVGAEKVIWGSDVPVTLNLYTYRQMLDIIRLKADFLTPLDREKIMGRNAREIFTAFNN